MLVEKATKRRDQNDDGKTQGKNKEKRNTNINAPFQGYSFPLDILIQ